MILDSIVLYHLYQYMYASHAQINEFELINRSTNQWINISHIYMQAWTPLRSVHDTKMRRCKLRAVYRFEDLWSSCTIINRSRNKWTNEQTKREKTQKTYVIYGLQLHVSTFKNVTTILNLLDRSLSAISVHVYIVGTRFDVRTCSTLG